MPKLRDTSWDPFSSPDDRGLHPNAFRTQADPSKGTQERYETRLEGDAAERITRRGDAGGPSPRVAIGSVTQQGGPAFGRPTAPPNAPSGGAGGSWGWLLGLGGLAFGAWALMRGGPKSNPGEPGLTHDEDGTPRFSLNPSPSPTPTVQVTVNVGNTQDGAPVTTTSTTVPAPSPSPALALPPVIEAVVVEEKPKRRRKRHRRTTQAKDENGKFLPAGTARAHTE